MRGREIPLFFSFLFSCVRGIPAESPLTSGDGRCFIHRNYYYEFVPGEVTWTEAERLCRQKFGFLATILTAEDNLKLLSLMQPVGVKHPLWIGAKLKKTGSGSFGSQILAFSGRTDTKFARLLKQFPQMHSVTVCAQLQFDSNYIGVSTIFSYSIPSFINEFQLRANIVHEAQIQLALLVHGVHSPYSQTIENDGRWHHICVKWTRRGGSWAIAVDGSIVASGDDLYLSDDIGQDGVFIVGQEQDTFGGSFKQDESFIGNITQLHIWNRDLDSSEIQALAEDCSVPQTGLFFQWNISALQVEPTVQVYEVFSQCKGLGFKTYEPFYISWVDGSVTPFHNISSDINITIAKEECITFDPLNGAWISEICSQLKETFCRYKKDVYEHMQIFSSIPPSPFFLQVKKIPTGGSIADYLLLNNSDYPQTVDRANNITKLLLETVDESDVSLTTVDLLALTRLLENVAYLGFETEANNSETLLNLATNYAQLASKIIDSKCSLQWLEVSEVIPGPYIIIHNFDLVAEKLADVSTFIGSDIVLSTENIDLRITTKQLPDLESGLVYKPACISARDRADEIQIPNFEVLRLLTLGYSELIFIHAYYRSLEHLYNPNSVLLAAKSGSSLQSRQLGTAVISSTVRDPLTARNVPVAVQYSLSHGALVRFPKFFKPECVFWNFSLQNGRFAGWSRQGCQVIQFEPEVTFCFCNHTTNFAVLLQFTEIQWSAEVESILNKLTFIGSGASLCALVVTLTLFTVLDIPKSDRTSIHKNLFVALIAAQVVLLSSDSATSNKVACVIVAALLHLFFMAAFAWMMVEGLLLWSKVVTVNLSEERRMKYYYLVGWGLPFLIVSITLAAAHDIYVADGHCWLNVHNGVIWAFVGPVIFIIMVNMFVLTRVVMITMSTAKRRAIMLAINSSPIEQAYDQIRAAMKAVLVLLPILGLTWLCGVLVPFSVVMAYIFVILNSLQGLFIFLIYGVYNTEVRSTIKRIKERRKALNFSNCASSRPSSSLTSSRPASSPVTGTESLAKDVGLHNGDGVNVQGICKMSFYDNSVIYENPAAANDRQLSTPSLSRGPDEELSCCSQSPVTSTKLTSEPPKRASEKGCKADCSLPGGLESMEDGCSLHVPTEFDEEPSCSLKSTSLKRVGSLYLD